MKMLYFEEKSGQFFPVIDGNKYFPINHEMESVSAQLGDTVTVGTRYGVNKLGAKAMRQAGRTLIKSGDVTFQVL